LNKENEWRWTKGTALHSGICMDNPWILLSVSVPVSIKYLYSSCGYRYRYSWDICGRGQMGVGIKTLKKHVCS
jgi:hypothetical protein